MLWRTLLSPQSPAGGSKASLAGSASVSAGYQVRIRESEGIPIRSIARPQPWLCSSAPMPAYSLKLDHRESCG